MSFESFAQNKYKKEDKNKEDIIDNYFPESYKKEVLPIIEIIKPDNISLSEYQDQISKDLFESVQRIRENNNSFSFDPEESVKEAKEILMSRLKSALKDARDYNKKTKPDEEFVKKAKIAMLFEGDLSDAENNSSYFKNGNIPSLTELRSYIFSHASSDNGNKNKFTESDINSLLKTKYAKSLFEADHMYYTGNYGTMENIPELLMIGFIQKKEGSIYKDDYFWPIKNGLELAENKKYSNECLEQLLSSGYEDLCLENFEKFKGKPIEKILKLGSSSDRNAIEYLKNLNLSREDFIKYLDILVQNSVCYNIRETFGKYWDNNGEVFSVYQDKIEKLNQVETDVDLKNDLENFITIKETISEGYLGLVLATHICNDYVKKYAENDYNNFLQSISQYNQEHLVFEYLKDEDKIKYVRKLIDQGEEFKMASLRKLFKEHSLGLDIFDKLNKKKLVPSFEGELSIFKDLTEKEALEFIDREKVEVFINNIDSFNFSEEFLYDNRVQESAFLEFEKEVSGLYPGKARKFFEKIPFSQEKVNNILIKTIDEKLGKKRIDWACSVIKNFPEIKPLLQEERFYKQAIDSLNVVTYSEHIADILECFPLPIKSLEDKDFVLKMIDTLSNNSYKVNNLSEKDQFFRIRRDYEQIIRISNFVKLPKYFIEFGETIERVESMNIKGGLNIKIDLLQILSKSKDPTSDLDKCFVLLEEINSVENIEPNKDLYIAYISKFLNSENEEEKKDFFEKINKDIKSLAQNEPADFNGDAGYYEYILKQVYPQRNYNTYQYLDKYENLNHHLDKYNFEKNGYDIKLSGLIGYKIKDGLEADQILLDKFSERVRNIKNLAKFDNLNNFLEKEISDSKAKTIEGKILEYFKQNNYSVDTMNVLLAYQLMGSYDDFASASADRLSAESDKVSKDYILLDEIANQYGDNMKETIKSIHSKVVDSPDKELFSDDNRDKKEKKYQDAFLITLKDLNKIPKEKLNNEIIKKKILKTIKNVFQGFTGIQNRSDYFSSLFSLNDFDNFEESWSKHINELFIIDDESSIDLSKIESLQSSVFNLIQAEINKYEEVKEVDNDRGEVKLKKDRLIKGYFSKNKENAHARMVADICIANDPNMLKNENYFEFVLFDQEKNKCAGTVMLLEMNEVEDNKKYLLYNPNPSVALVSEVSAKKLYQLLSKNISKFAKDNNFDAVLVDKTHGKSTNRAGLFQQSLEQSCLKDESGREIEFNLKNNHCLGSSYFYQNNLRAVWINS